MITYLKKQLLLRALISKTNPLIYLLYSTFFYRTLATSCCLKDCFSSIPILIFLIKAILTTWYWVKINFVSSIYFNFLEPEEMEFSADSNDSFLQLHYVFQGVSTKGCTPFTGFTNDGLFQAMFSNWLKYHNNQRTCTCIGLPPSLWSSHL